MNGKKACSYIFQEFVINVRERQLLKNDVAISLTPKAFDVLAALVERAGHLVEKDELIQWVWPDSFVEETNLTRIIHTLRRTLGEKDVDKFIETVPKKGYRFVAPVDIYGSSEQKVFSDGHDHPANGRPTPLLKEEPATETGVGARFILIGAGMLFAIFLLLGMFSFQLWRPSRSTESFTNNEEANRLYLLGAALANKGGRKNAEKAVEYLKESINLDPNFAPAYAGLASAHTSIAITAAGDTHEQYIKAKMAIEKAIALNGNLAETQSALGDLKWICEWDFAGAETAYKRSLELDPNVAQYHRKYAMYLISMGRIDEAIAEIKIAVEFEPALSANHRAFAQILLYARRYDDAAIRAKQTLEMDADFVVAHNFLMAASLAKGDYDQAFASFLDLEKANGSKPQDIQAWQTLYDGAGWKGINERRFSAAQEAEKAGDPNYMYLANLAVELDLHDQAFAYLEKTYAKRQWAMVMLNANPRYDPIRSDPRFHDLVKRVGLQK